MKCPHCGKNIKVQLGQTPIKDYKQIAYRIMKHLYKSEEGDNWDRDSGAHRYWLRYCKKNFHRLKNYMWYQIYKEARDENKRLDGTL